MERDLGTIVVGGGLTGLLVAEGLAGAGDRPLVLEKSRGLGGRLATRRVGDLRFDHGAQYLKGSSAAEAVWARLAAAGVAAQWDVPGIGPRYVGLPGMSGLVAPLAAAVEIRQGTEVARASFHAGLWQVEDASGRALATAPRLVLAIPAPQAARLLVGDPLAAALAGVVFAPCWTLLVAFADRAALPEVARQRQGPLGWVARDGAKPGRGGAHTWVAQATADWSRMQLEIDKADAAERLLSLLEASAAAPLPAPTYLAAHRWRFSQVEVPLGQPCLADADRRLVIAGDWCLGPHAGDAATSADAALAALGTMPAG